MTYNNHSNRFYSRKVNRDVPMGQTAQHSSITVSECFTSAMLGILAQKYESTVLVILSSTVWLIATASEQAKVTLINMTRYCYKMYRQIKQKYSIRIFLKEPPAQASDIQVQGKMVVMRCWVMRPEVEYSIS